MNNIKFRSLLCCMFALSVPFASCVKIADAGSNSTSVRPGSSTSSGGGNANSGENSRGDEIRKSVSVSASYSDYTWYIKVRVSDSSLYPSPMVRYGLVFGYTGLEYPLNPDEDFFFTKFFNDVSGSAFSLKEPLFVDADPFPYVMSFIYWRTYWALRERTDNGETLSSEEKDLWNVAIKSLKQGEAAVLHYYWGIVFVEIDGERYSVGRFGHTSALVDIPLYSIGLNS